jgi:hypothetical protein
MQVSGSSMTMPVLSLSQAPLLLDFRGNNEARDMKAELQGGKVVEDFVQFMN